MDQPLALVSAGMISCNAIGAEANAAMMRCGYSNFSPTYFKPDSGPGPQLGATALVDEDLIGLGRLVAMARAALTGALQSGQPPQPEIAFLLCFADPTQLLPSLGDDFPRTFLDRLTADLPIRARKGSAYFHRGRTGLLHAVATARERLYEQGYDEVLVVLVDSLLNNHRMRLYDPRDGICRLLQERHPNGFIPGEAAVALLLARPDGSPQTCITGIGVGTEPAPINSGEILRAEGLTTAIRTAAEEAGIRVCETDFRISSANGEDYWFKEASIAQSRTLEEKRTSHPLWHPADNIGEVGAAVGGAMLVMAHDAFLKGYAPGPRAICQLSNDDGERGAFILEYRGGAA